MRFVNSLAIALLTGILNLPAGAGEKSETAKLVYEYVMEQVGEYGGLPEPKVMVACINWDAPTALGYNVRNVFVTYTGITSDRPIFAGKLAQDAKRRCKKWAKSEMIDCTCQRLDSNGKNVLKVPGGK
jgi:hypothetical protein